MKNHRESVVTYQHILYEVNDKIATVTLNRPDRMNAWTAIMERDVRHAMEAAAADDNVRVIVLTGAGRAFCAGADMEGLKGIDPNEIRRGENTPFDMNRRADWQTRYAYYPAIPKPVIGMLNGATAGIGLVHALYCDLRFAADNTVFTTAFSRRGLIAEHGISWMLPHIVGHANALDLLMSSRRVSSEEALRIGLVNRLYPPDQLREQTYRLCPRSRRFRFAKRDLGDQAPALRRAVPDAGGSHDRRQPGNAGRAEGQRFQGGRGELYGEAAAEVYGEVRGGWVVSTSPSSPWGFAGHHASPFWLRRGCATRSPKGEAWWSQAGSNRRPRHCERRALPAELWPRRDRLERARRSAIGAIYSPRQGQVKNGAEIQKAVFGVILPGTSLVCGGMNRYLAG